MGEGAEVGRVAADDSLKIGATMSEVTPSLEIVQGRAALAAALRIAVHGP